MALCYGAQTLNIDTQLATSDACSRHAGYHEYTACCTTRHLNRLKLFMHHRSTLPRPYGRLSWQNALSAEAHNASGEQPYTYRRKAPLDTMYERERGSYLASACASMQDKEAMAQRWQTWQQEQQAVMQKQLQDRQQQVRASQKNTAAAL